MKKQLTIWLLIATNNYGKTSFAYSEIVDEFSTEHLEVATGDQGDLQKAEKVVKKSSHEK